VLPHVLDAMREREPEAIDTLAAALGARPGDLAAVVAVLGGGGSLADLGVRSEQLPAVADAALARPELHAMTPPPSREELLSLLRRASRG
jgi:alcohol dehydrogenase class IV